MINETGKQHGNVKDWLDRKKTELEEHQSRLEREKESNQKTRALITVEEREALSLRERSYRKLIKKLRTLKVM